MRYVILILTMAVLALPFSAVTHAGQAIGKVAGIRGKVLASGPQGRRVLRLAGDVFKGDRIRTGQSEVQIIFSDDTRLAVGPESVLNIDEYVFDSKTTARSLAIRAAKGAFRFITGHSKKSAYSIKTRNATIGIRGTSFDISAHGQSRVLLYTGSIRVCQSASNCRNLVNRCEMAVVGGNRPVHRGTTAELTSRILARAFPYVLNEKRLPGSFRVSSANCGAGLGKGRRGGLGGGGGGEGAGGDGGNY